MSKLSFPAIVLLPLAP